MTSKEKLDYIYQNIDKLKQYFEDLEKELEVLEILKDKKIFISNYPTMIEKDEYFVNILDLDKEEAEKIADVIDKKEWFENDK